MLSIDCQKHFVINTTLHIIRDRFVFMAVKDYKEKINIQPGPSESKVLITTYEIILLWVKIRSSLRVKNQIKV